MRYALKASVEGRVRLDDPRTLTDGTYAYEFELDASHHIAAIVVSVDVPEDKKADLRSSIGPGSGGSKATITIGASPELYRDLVMRLQQLESDLAFGTRGALKRINWISPIQEDFIPETPEEAKQLPVGSVSMRREYPDVNTDVRTDSLLELIEAHRVLEPLTLLKAFWLEGMRAFEAFQYVIAFYHFYFVIEESYADGKTRAKQVLNAYRKSKEFSKIAEATYAAIRSDDRHGDKLVELMRSQRCESSGPGFQMLLHKIRGQLHHSTGRGKKLRPDPYSQQDHETIALVAMHAATLAIGYQETALLKAAKGEPRADE